MDELLGKTMGGRFQILKHLGEGGMGAVYEARHLATQRRVALKLITGGPEKARERLARLRIEAKAAGRIDSDHIARVLDLGSDDDLDLAFMAMEYLEGEDLASLFERSGKLPTDLALARTNTMRAECRCAQRRVVARGGAL